MKTIETNLMNHLPFHVRMVRGRNLSIVSAFLLVIPCLALTFVIERSIPVVVEPNDVRIKRQSSPDTVELCAKDQQFIGMLEVSDSMFPFAVRPLRFSVTGPSSAVTINPTNGELFYTAPNPPTQLSVPVQITDALGSSRTVSASILNPNACPAGSTPRQPGILFTNPAYTFTVNNCETGNIIGTVRASYVGGQLIYQSAVRPIPNINLNPFTGQLYLVGIISGVQRFEVYAYTLSGDVPPVSTVVTVVGTCKAPPPTTTETFEPSTALPTSTSMTTTTTRQPTTSTSIVSVADDQYFLQRTYQFTPPSCAAMTRAGQITTRTPAIVILEKPNLNFTVDPTTGNVLSNNAHVGNHVLEVRALTPDRRPTSSRAFVIITCPNEFGSPLVWGRQPFQFQVPNCAAGTTIGSVYVLNPRPSLRFRIQSLNTAVPFRIDEPSGVLFARSSLLSGASYSFVVIATIDGSQPRPGRVFVNTTENCVGSSGIAPFPKTFNF